MKYMPLDLSVMQPEPFPHPVMMRSDLYARRQPSREEKWGICPGSVCGALRVLVRRCREEAERRKLAMSILSVAGACVFGLMAVGVFWLAVEMDNSALQASKSSCSINRKPALVQGGRNAFFLRSLLSEMNGRV